MQSREEFAALMRADQQQQVEGWARQMQGSPAKSRPRQAPKYGEQAPLLPPMPQSALPPPLPSSQQFGSRSKPKRHGRSHSDFPFSVPLADPFSKHQGPSPPPPGVGVNRSNRPPRAGAPHSMIPPPPPSQSVVSPLSYGSPQGQGPAGGTTTRKALAHRRAKSDIPSALFGDRGGMSVGGGRLLTKSDLLKNLPSPRWGGPIKPLTHSRSNSRSDVPLSHSRSSSRGDVRSRTGSVESVSSGGYLGYGAISIDEGNPLLQSEGNPLLQSIGSVQMAPGSGARHKRLMSDASAMSVTIDMAKSALFKGVTETGRIRLQLPKDSFRILMDSQLEAGCVYKRKLVDNEDDYFLEFHTGGDGDSIDSTPKRLPPDLYVMAVDSTIYRRMLDEVIASKSMPCGTFFCGHHEDVRHPDITIAALIVGVVFLVLVAGVIWVPGT
mmetsp:Transcript_14485/g.31420  ORF Transcript_14485/g.31420 Transcript_14485/m.31420 type:complete len:438 (+) Transcript_14485:134-1447(+)|eukprot:CAMPEP_0172311526 /NCGR_PEP_ID=MMETSP1058-20130122/14986_1 /TAXON_ID=83371 /ORGANISM="Detonula confervacea, Strain CCMP 353" /LENGTH=437 /DNA_ID=CAMNT_0013024727 /DNA_START=70 /DNA_END=1383 /DNA_ORIENTATION=+